MIPEDPRVPTDELLFRFIADLCPAPERGAVESWLHGDAANERRLADLRRIWAASRPISERDVDRMWTRLHGAVGASPESEATFMDAEVPAGRIPRSAFARLSARKPSPGVWAAAVLVAAGIVMVIGLPHSTPPVRPVVAAHTYATGPAQVANVRLRDGTRVVLAPESRLTVPDAFGDAERVVDLDGQAFFDVVHNPARPFRARAKGAVAEDIGTRFDMRAYGDDPGVVVVVAAGAVTLGHAAGVGAGAEGVVVRPGERARTDGPGGATTLDHVPLDLTGWTDGRLSFAKTPLAEVARTLARWYNLDVRVPDAALQARLITADFDTQSPKEMVAALATAVGGAVVQDGRTLTIRAHK